MGLMHMVIAILARIGTSTFAVAVLEATFVIVTCGRIYGGTVLYIKEIY